MTRMLQWQKPASMFYPDCEYQSFYFDKDDLINSSEKPKKYSQNVFIRKVRVWEKIVKLDHFKIGPGEL